MLTKFNVPRHSPDFKMISDSKSSPVTLPNTVNKRKEEKNGNIPTGLMSWTRRNKLYIQLTVSFDINIIANEDIMTSLYYNLFGEQVTRGQPYIQLMLPSKPKTTPTSSLLKSCSWE